MLRLADVSLSSSHPKTLQHSLAIMVPVPRSSSLHNPRYSVMLGVGQHHTRNTHHTPPPKMCSKHITKGFPVFSTCDHKDQACKSFLKGLQIYEISFQNFEFKSITQQPTVLPQKPPHNTCTHTRPNTLSFSNQHSTDLNSRTCQVVKKA